MLLMYIAHSHILQSFKNDSNNEISLWTREFMGAGCGWGGCRMELQPSVWFAFRTVPLCFKGCKIAFREFFIISVDNLWMFPGDSWGLKDFIKFLIVVLDIILFSEFTQVIFEMQFKVF